jgi:hypothetical protein
LHFAEPAAKLISEAKRRIFALMVDHLSTIRLAAIRQSGHWRVEMKWPKHASRYFGEFHSQSEAEEWIEEHRWMSARRQEPDAEAFELLKDEVSLAAVLGGPDCSGPDCSD